MNNPKLAVKLLGGIALVLGVNCVTSSAELIQTVGQGSAVTKVDASTQFSDITYGESLSSYSSNGISVTQAGGYELNNFDPTDGNGAANGAFQGGLFFYAYSGTVAPTVISDGGAAMYALEMSVGFPVQPEYIDYSSSDGKGTFAIAPGSIIGFSDAAGITSLEIAAYADLSSAQNALADNFTTGDNAIALDNLAIQTSAPTSSTPEPGAIAMMMGGLGLVAVSKFRCRLGFGRR